MPTGPAAQRPEPAVAETAAQLAAQFPALFGPGPPKPVKLRIHADIQARAPGQFTRRQLSLFLHRHTTSTAYLRALAASTQRFDLDGQPAGDVAAEHRDAAEAEVARRRAVVDQRRAAERAARGSRPAAPGRRGGSGSHGSPAPPPAPDAAHARIGPGDAPGARRCSPVPGAPEGPERGAPDAPRHPERGAPSRGSATDRPPRAAAERGRGHRDALNGPGPRDAREGRGPRDARGGPDPRSLRDRGGPRPPRDPAAGDRPRASTNAPHRSAPREAADPLPDDPDRRERALLLRAWEGSPLTPANFCALKGLKVPDFEARIALAQRERAERQAAARRAAAATVQVAPATPAAPSAPAPADPDGARAEPPATGRPD